MPDLDARSSVLDARFTVLESGEAPHTDPPNNEPFDFSLSERGTHTHTHTRTYPVHGHTGGPTPSMTHCRMDVWTLPPSP